MENTIEKINQIIKELDELSIKRAEIMERQKITRYKIEQSRIELSKINIK